jgi:hypothetical protein
MWETDTKPTRRVFINRAMLWSDGSCCNRMLSYGYMAFLT